MQARARRSASLRGEIISCIPVFMIQRPCFITASRAALPCISFIPFSRFLINRFIISTERISPRTVGHRPPLQERCSHGSVSRGHERLTEALLQHYFSGGGAEETLGLGAVLSAVGCGGGVLCKVSVGGAAGFCTGAFGDGAAIGVSRR